ncbi:MAG: ATP-grasp domain-containing protein [Candidatus Moranbacteria bacterium]|nr:ATP-grasp domain-containing protein [Candidatus Moranbacteria bacterium]
MLKIGVLRGGADEKYRASLDNGANILACLREEDMVKKYKAVDIFIDEEGIWHIDGIPVTMNKVRDSVDMVINALLGKYAENGQIQKSLEEYGIPYACSDSSSSYICHNKFLTKEEFQKLGIRTPQFIHFKSIKEGGFDKNNYSGSKARAVWEKISPPWIVKPVTNGASVGVVLCKTFTDLVNAIRNIADIEDEIIVEEYIKGKEASVGIINNFRNKEMYVLPPVEIRLNKGDLMYDSVIKAEKSAKIICPGNFTEKEKEELENSASLIHRHLGLKFYSKTDFIVHPKRGAYALEVNTQSEFMEKTIIPEALDAVGSNVKELTEHLIKEALK